MEAGTALAAASPAPSSFLLLALGAQWLAERRGAPERERRRRQAWGDIAGWPRWKQIAVLTVAVAVAITMLILSLLSAL